jgi:2-polyprenyl-3-methyl-5-hydroxy-6-metoxy-1,4-benzoquinol methylase
MTDGSWLAWDHNTYYHDRLLRTLPAHCERVLDVGCGAGAFAARLATRADRVDALDRSAVMIEAARRAVPANVTCLLGDVRTAPLPVAGYDAITCISALHHMPLPEVLPRLAGALRPGGTLVAVSHHRREAPRDVVWQAVEAFAVFGRRAVLLWLPAARRYRREMYRRERTGPVMPVMRPRLSVREVRAQAVSALPGASVRRLPFWRYELLWRKPANE